MGLGGFPVVALADARSRALTIRAGIKSSGTDPLATRREAVTGKVRLAAVAKAAAPKATTFGEVARDYLHAHRAASRNARHGTQWDSTLCTYAEPVFGATPVEAIDRELVLNHVRGRGLRTGENPST